MHRKSGGEWKLTDYEEGRQRREETRHRYELRRNMEGNTTYMKEHEESLEGNRKCYTDVDSEEIWKEMQ